MKTREAFVPPKPKEFVSAALMGLSSVAPVGLKPSVKIKSGRSRLIVGGTFCCRRKGTTH